MQSECISIMSFYTTCCIPGTRCRLIPPLHVHALPTAEPEPDPTPRVSHPSVACTGWWRRMRPVRLWQAAAEGRVHGGAHWGDVVPCAAGAHRGTGAHLAAHYTGVREHWFCADVWWNRHGSMYDSWSLACMVMRWCEQCSGCMGGAHAVRGEVSMCRCVCTGLTPAASLSGLYV